MLAILIELPGGAGVVRRDDGEIVITGDISDGRGSALRRLDYRPVTSWLDGGTRIRASVCGGAYVAIVNEPRLSACCLLP